MWTATAARVAPLPDIVTAEMLRAAGVDVDVGRRAAAAGVWRELVRGAWLRSAREPTARDRREAVLLRLGGEAVLTGADACDVLGLRDVPADSRTSVLVDSSVQRDLGDRVRVLRTGALPEALVVRGLRVAPAERAVVDAARAAVDLQTARSLVLAAVADGWCDVPGLRGCLDAGPRRGSAHCRRVLADAVRGAASAPEAEVADVLQPLVRRGRLPPFVLNRAVWVRGRLMGLPDGWFPGLGLGWEVDSLRHHGGSGQLQATLDRHAGFSAHGLELVHVTPASLRADPATFVAQLSAAAARRAALAFPEPSDLQLLRRHLRPAAP